jgi:predicted CoA-binding protein
VPGEKSYNSFLDIPLEIQKTIDGVIIFKPSRYVPPIVNQSVKLKKMHGKPQLVWIQLGIVNEKAAEAVKKAGLSVVMNKCMMIEHKLFFRLKSGTLSMLCRLRLVTQRLQ